MSIGAITVLVFVDFSFCAIWIWIFFLNPCVTSNSEHIFNITNLIGSVPFLVVADDQIS